MNKFLLLLLLFVFSLCLFTDCTYQKRLYRKGYYTEWFSSHKNTKNSLITQQQNKYWQLPIKSSPIKLSIPSNENILVSKNLEHSLLKFRKKNVLPDDSCADKIILKTGDEFIVKIIEISDKEIKYKRCDNFNGPLYTISSSKVYMIEYANGIKEHIISEHSEISKSKSSENNTQNKSLQNKKYSNTYWITLGLFIAGFFGGIALFTWPYALITARKARREINQNPHLKGKFEMGIIMYFLLIFFTLMSVFSAVVGLLFILYFAGTVGPTSALAYVLGTVFLIIGLLIGYFVYWFFKTSEKNDF